MIYYSHINEDNRVERNLLQQGRYPAIVAICGSGERVLSLMDNANVKHIYVVDQNIEAIFLLQLKTAALSRLSVPTYLGFIGHLPMDAKERANCFSIIEKKLPQQTSSFWQQRISLIEKGVLHIGHFEKFLHRVRPLNNLCLGKGFQKVFNDETEYPASLRWKLLKKMFSYKLVYRMAGNRDTAFIGSKAEMSRIPSALDRTLKNRKASSSFMAHLVFKGNLSQMKEEDLPPSLQTEVLGTIKQRLMNGELTIEYVAEDLKMFLKKQAENLQLPVFYSLSDILSFVDFNYLASIMKDSATKGSCIVTRSFLRNRLSDVQLAQLNAYGELSIHDDQEATGMYQVFSLKTFHGQCQ